MSYYLLCPHRHQPYNAHIHLFFHLSLLSLISQFPLPLPALTIHEVEVVGHNALVLAGFILLTRLSRNLRAVAAEVHVEDVTRLEGRQRDRGKRTGCTTER